MPTADPLRPVLSRVTRTGARLGTLLTGVAALACVWPCVACTRSYARIVAVTSANVTLAEGGARPGAGPGTAMGVAPGAPASPLTPPLTPPLTLPRKGRGPRPARSCRRRPTASRAPRSPPPRCRPMHRSAPVLRP